MEVGGCRATNFSFSHSLSLPLPSSPFSLYFSLLPSPSLSLSLYHTHTHSRTHTNTHTHTHTHTHATAAAGVEVRGNALSGYPYSSHYSMCVQVLQRTRAAANETARVFLNHHIQSPNEMRVVVSWGATPLV